MKTSSCKAKGRRCAVEVKELLLKYAPDLHPADIEVTTSSVTGEDLKLSPVARKVYPLVVECKNVERINIWDAIKQSVAHLKKHKHETEVQIPVVFFKRNNSKLMICLEAEEFLKFIR